MSCGVAVIVEAVRWRALLKFDQRPENLRLSVQFSDGSRPYIQGRGTL